jgi:magnesium transporter
MLMVVSAQQGGAAMEAYWISDAGIKPLPDDAIRELASRDDGVLWIHLNHTNEAGMALLNDLIPARSGDVTECHTRTPVPKLHAYADHYFSAMNGLVRGTDGRLHFQPMKMFIAPTVLYTVIGPHHAALTEEALHRDVAVVRQRIEQREFCPRSGFELGAAIRIEMLRAQEELVATGAAQIAQLELNLLRLSPVKTELLLDDLFGLRHDLQTIRTNAAQTHEMYSHLTDQLGSQTGLMALDPRRLSELRQGYNHLRNTTDLEREYLQEVLDLFQTRISTELNRFVRKLTAFGTIGIAWTVITGIYGMNFDRMPELHWYYGYPAAIGVMLIVGGVLAWLFRRQGWL